MLETGKIIHTFISKMDNHVIVRYPRWEDLDEILRYINLLSAEDTFLRLGGEVMTKQQEAEYLAHVLEEMELRNGCHLYAFVNGVLIGNCGISRRGKRNEHIGRIGISVAKEFRGQGIGTELLSLLLKEAEKLGFTMVDLKVYSTNDRAYHVYEKLGFVEAGRMPQAVRYQEGFLDEIWMFKKIN